MKWAINKIRWRRKFCLLPVKIKDQMVWLEWVWVKEERTRYFWKTKEVRLVKPKAWK